MSEPRNTATSGRDDKTRLPDGAIDLQHHTELPTTRLSRALDTFVAGTGKLLSWLWLAVVAVILVSVISRYMFGQGSILLEELSWHIYGVAWTLGLGYTLVADAHVRVDVLHERLSLRAQAWIEMLGIVLLLMPFLYLGIHYGIPYAYDSFLRNETSQAPSGLSHRFLVKSLIPLSMAFIAVAAFSRLLKCTALLFGTPQPENEDPEAFRH